MRTSPCVTSLNEPIALKLHQPTKIGQLWLVTCVDSGVHDEQCQCFPPSKFMRRWADLH